MNRLRGLMARRDSLRGPRRAGRSYILGNMVDSILSLGKTLTPWVGGIVLFLAFLLTFWPARLAMIVAAVLWTIGILSTTFWQAFLLFHDGLMASAFTSEPVPLVSWLLPVITIVVVLAESTLLFPWVLQKRALCVGRILFLVVAPAVFIFTSVANMGFRFYQFPLGASWLAYPLLWFRIREKLNDRAATLGAN